ncbi:MAG: SCO family protein [Bacteroidota bacterium]
MGIFNTSNFSTELILFLTLIAIVSVHKIMIIEKELPVYNPTDINPLLVDGSLQNVGKGHTVLDFSLVNQNGDTITQEDYENTVYVTDFIFTRCPSICPIMTNNMGKLQNKFLENDRVKLLSLSVTPEMDSVPVLRAYADRNKVLDFKWNIVTGDKKHIYELARKSYFTVADEGDGGLQDFIHTEKFVLVDTKKQIRGIYDGTNANEMERLIQDIETLLN